MIVIPIGQWDRLCEHVAQAAPEEACGLLAAYRYAPAVVELAVPMLNMAEHPRYRYAIDPRHHMEAVAKLDAQNLRITGLYHSHIGAGPELSPEDVRYAVDASKLHLVVGHDPQERTFDAKLWRVERPGGVPIQVPVEWHIV